MQPNITVLSEQAVQERLKTLKHVSPNLRRIKPFSEFSISGTVCLPETVVGANSPTYWPKSLQSSLSFNFDQKGILKIKGQDAVRFIGLLLPVSKKKVKFDKQDESYYTVKELAIFLNGLGFEQWTIGLFISQVQIIEETFVKKVLYITDGVGKLSVCEDDKGFETFFVYELENFYCKILQKEKSF